jgi:hypothetical protein
MSLVKGGIYGVFFPISGIGVGLSFFCGTPSQINEHFIPYSKYN